ncbi:MAG: DUF982 domain-containing protein [Rhizobiaceae bacterium]|nr:DUF982 domain-containing protein [Rhizobiaceae bacterium]
MQHVRFEEPVTVLVGLGSPSRIDSVMEAYALLKEWPAAGRASGHTVVLNACRASLAGEIDAETVRAMLVAFARRNDVLMPDMTELAPGLAGSEAYGKRLVGLPSSL